MQKALNVDIAGRTQKITSSNPLLPLFEAVVNSIQSIEEVRLENNAPQYGSIVIDLIRASDQSSLELKDGSFPAITGFVISDDGIGFTERNFASFCTSDSQYKKTAGGKGVGRFSWLKFFEDVALDSSFSEGGNWLCRNFKFSNAGIDNDNKIAAKASGRRTVISLTSMFSKYQERCPKALDLIADRLVEHLLSYFATATCPLIFLKDGTQSINLQERYSRLFAKDSIRRKITLKDRDFDIVGLRLYQGNLAHKLHLCASKRVAESLVLSKFDSMLGRKLEDKDGKNFTYWAFVESPYLDDIVNEDRIGLRFPDEDDATEDLERNVTRTELIGSVVPGILTDLSNELEQIRQSNKERVTRYVDAKAPEYRFVIKQNPDRVALISRTSEKDMDSELRRIQFDIETNARNEVRAMLDNTPGPVVPSAEYEQKTTQLLSLVNDIGKSSLSKYVVQRRVILDILKKRMELDGEKYSLEKAIHELIFPLGETSDDIEYEKQNLWIIDERLSYHSYLGSDKPLSTTPANTESNKEPDLIVFNRPLALDNQGGQAGVFESVEIVEFKRPGRDDYTDADHPVLQVMKYIEKIRAGREKNAKGRPITVSPTTHFFCYVLCDITPKLKIILERLDFLETPDKQGLFRYAMKHNAYIEVMSYDKMVRLAEQRNRILFEKLQIK